MESSASLVRLAVNARDEQRARSPAAPPQQDGATAGATGRNSLLDDPCVMNTALLSGRPRPSRSARDRSSTTRVRRPPRRSPIAESAGLRFCASLLTRLAAATLDARFAGAHGCTASAACAPV